MEVRGWKTNGILTPPGALLHNITHPSTHLPSVFTNPSSCNRVCVCCVFPPSGMALGVALVCVLCMSMRLHGWVNGYWQHHLWPLTHFAVLINSAEHKQGCTFPAVLFIVAIKATRTLLQPPLTPHLPHKKNPNQPLAMPPASLNQTRRLPFKWCCCKLRENKKPGL